MASGPTYRFSSFEVHAGLGELRRHGIRIRLAGKPFELLVALLERPNEIVSREELWERLWPGVHVDRERGLNNAMSRLREALGDSAANPSMIETVPKRGYRFIAELRADAPPAAIPEATARRTWPYAVAGVAAVFIIAVVLHPMKPRREMPAPAAYVAAQYRLKQDRPEQLPDVLRLLEEATRESPGYALAWAALAQAHVDLMDYGFESRVEALQAAKIAAERSLRTDPRSSEAQYARALVRLRFEWDLRGARDQVRIALRLNPRLAAARRLYATVLAAQGDTEGAVREMRQACSIEPASTTLQLSASKALYLNRSYAEAEQRVMLALRMDPQLAAAHRLLVDIYLAEGRERDAAAQFVAFLEALKIDPAEVSRDRAMLDRDGFRGLYETAVQSPPKRHDERLAYKYAAMYTVIGNVDQAITYLRQAIAVRDTQALFIGVDPQFDRLRNAPTFARMMRDAGLM